MYTKECRRKALLLSIMDKFSAKSAQPFPIFVQKLLLLLYFYTFHHHQKKNCKRYQKKCWKTQRESFREILFAYIQKYHHKNKTQIELKYEQVNLHMNTRMSDVKSVYITERLTPWIHTVRENGVSYCYCLRNVNKIKE